MGKAAQTLACSRIDGADFASTLRRPLSICYRDRMTAEIEPVLRRLRAALDEAYGDRIERVVLFGSRARGDARADSDYDVAVFLKDMRGFWDESALLADIGTEILRNEGVVINALPLEEGSYRERTGFMGEVRREGIDF